MKKLMTSNQWRIYNLLKERAVGKENAIHAKDIIETLQFENYSERTIRKDIRAIRECPIISRKIGSGGSGYYLATQKEEEPHKYLVKQIVSRLETAVREGVPVEYFYSVLNSLETDNAPDGQTRLTFSKHEKDVIKRYSNDLKGD